MGLFDKINKNDLISKAKGAVDSASNGMKTAMGEAKAKHEQKKAEQAAYDAEMKEKAITKAEEIVASIKSYSNEGSVFEKTGGKELQGFTKLFYDKILMPANSVGNSHISMYPYIDAKRLEKFKKGRTDYEETEVPLIYIRSSEKQEILITENKLYFSVSLEEDRKYFAKSSVNCSEISKFVFELGETESVFKCDENILATFITNKSVKEDFITLTEYFERIGNRDFEITDEDTDAIIKEKIGEKVLQEVKKYMVFDDELMLYFAWGLDSLSAKDYIVCTDKQIIIMDREAFGMTANVKQFYYDDITSASTEQNSNSSDLTGFLIESALTSLTKTCDLVISVAGSISRINTLYKVEAERVVAVYHQCRKALKVSASQPQVVVQQTAVDPVEQIRKLKEMCDLGIISEEEFNIKKADLLAKI